MTSTTATPAVFYRRLREFVIEETRAQRDSFHQELKKELTKRVNDGRCVSEVRFTGRTTAGAYRFECPANDSDFREGDFVRLHLGDPFEPVAELAWMGDGLLPDGKEFIDFDKPFKGSASRYEKGVKYTIDATHIDLSGIYEAALDELGRSERGRERILPLLMGSGDDESMDPNAYDAAFTAAAADGFNPSQQEAIADGVAASLCSLIQGPPGTGKTRVLANIVKARVLRGERVLVTACTHRAIHEALRAISKAMPGFDRIAKISQPVTDRELPVPFFETFADTPFANSGEGYVIGATPFAARGKRLAGVTFDAVLIDEASQMTLPLAVMAMLSADTYVIIGDPQQLPPVIQTCRMREAVEHSLFSSLGRGRDIVRLNTTYRLNGPIAQWIGDHFYPTGLQSWEGARDRRLTLSGQPKTSWLAQALSATHSLVWIRTTPTNTRHYSMEEAGLVTQILVELHHRGHRLDEVGVVTPFRRQARVIRKRLRDHLEAPVDGSSAVVIDTVERMQGQEREVMLISTAASDPGFIGAIRDFLYLPQRLNVAASRARTKVIVLASDGFLAGDGCSPGEAEDLALWHSLRASSLEITL